LSGSPQQLEEARERERLISFFDYGQKVVLVVLEGEEQREVEGLPCPAAGHQKGSFGKQDEMKQIVTTAKEQKRSFVTPVNVSLGFLSCPGSN
jgi:hypothetical protein